MKNEVQSLLQTAGAIRDIVRMGENSSLTDYTKSSRVQPLTLVDRNINNMPPDQVQAIMQTALALYTGHYLQAVNLHATVGDVTALSIIDKFGTDRSFLDSIATSSWIPAGESADGLDLASMDINGVGLERDEAKLVNTADWANLAVGKVISVPLTAQGKTVTVTVQISTLPTVVSSDELTRLVNEKDNSWKGRFRRWRAGELSLTDYLTANDIIEADREALLNDKTGLYSAKRSKKRQSLIASIISGRSSIQVASSIVVITKSTARRLESAMRGKFAKSRDREKFFEETLAMMLFVVDPELETFTLYQKGISDVGYYTLSDIEQNGRSPQGVDINAAMRSYQKSISPTL